MRVVNVVVGIPAASVAVEVSKVYHGGSSWVGGDAMWCKEYNYSAVKRKFNGSLVESVGCPRSGCTSQVSAVVPRQAIRSLQELFRDFWRK